MSQNVCYFFVCLLYVYTLAIQIFIRANLKAVDDGKNSTEYGGPHHAEQQHEYAQQYVVVWRLSIFTASDRISVI